ncbi:cytochrome b562 [Pseudoalteromonas luteoviolacea]|uniref:Cytochrome b562 family protein n=1 Tax=Pseudoalteromonas luteoviolacea NCIMB 1942 TaxID=1365253 RepID=A0A167HQQ4_9GAMM|nr:cytochrome b562 [Pseudoalteromonas luteoviolacea]KZN58399.1 hypothetical protein N482_22385 [Pseudoalteromonas luteoviolacea NCIMB 1942]KZX01340.1 hypothetical protein JL49_06395 [Pseudoalteromonas luteoviolacea]
MKFIIILAILLSGFAHSGEVQDLNQIMKKMGHEYKLAVKAQAPSEMSLHIGAFIELVELAKTQRFQEGKANESIKGLEQTIELAKQARSLARSKNLVSAKAKLKKIDDLRIEYHKLHEPPSIWDLLFGG